MINVSCSSMLTLLSLCSAIIIIATKYSNLGLKSMIYIPQYVK